MAAVERTGITWQLAHEVLSRLARERAAADAEEGRWLLAAQRAAVHVHLGYGAFSEYVERMSVRHADGSEYGGRVMPRALELRTKVFSALRNLGFREAMVRAALEQLEREPAPEQAFDGLLRAALARLCPAGVRR